MRIFSEAHHTGSNNIRLNSSIDSIRYMVSISRNYFCCSVRVQNEAELQLLANFGSVTRTVHTFIQSPDPDLGVQDLAELVLVATVGIAVLGGLTH